MRSVRGGRAVAVCAVFAFAVPASAQAGTGAGKARSDAAKAGAKHRSSARTAERRISDRQYIRFADRRLGFCVIVDPDED